MGCEPWRAAPTQVCTAGGGWEGLWWTVPTQVCLQWEIGRSPCVHSWGTEEQELPNPKPAPSKHRAELLLEAGLRRWVPRKDTLQEQVRDI